MQSPRNAGSLIGAHSFLMRDARKLTLLLRRWSYCWLFWTFWADVSCHLPCGCALFGTGAACADAATRAVRATNVVEGRAFQHPSWREPHDIYCGSSQNGVQAFCSRPARDQASNDRQGAPVGSGAPIASFKLLSMVGNAVPPVPIPPPIAPMVPVPAPAAAPVDQLDRRRSLNRSLAWRLCKERRRLCRHRRQGYPADKYRDQSAHLYLHEGRGAHCRGTGANKS
jgi:hypothetical protein